MRQSEKMYLAVDVLNAQMREFEAGIEELNIKEDENGGLSWLDSERRATMFKVLESYRKVASDLSLSAKLQANSEGVLDE